MKTIRSVDEMRQVCADLRKQGKRVGLVPTMGALHAGHASLIRAIRSQCDVCVVSIFVNPAQFGPAEDFQKYPRTLERDVVVAQREDCDIVFAPTDQGMYPAGYRTFVDVDELTDRLCGKIRPGHFRGVATVVLKLFNIIDPDVAVFGQKDAQQVIVLKCMVQDLNLRVRMIVVPTVRESDGLARSSRNVYLTPVEREEVSQINAGLRRVEVLYGQGTSRAEELLEAATLVYESCRVFTVEYLECVDLRNLRPVVRIDNPALVAVACRTTQSRVRLIDNTVLNGEL